MLLLNAQKSLMVGGGACSQNTPALVVSVTLLPSSVLELRQVGGRVDSVARDAVLVLIIRDRVGDRLGGLLAIRHELAAWDVTVVVLLHHLLVVVRLHEVGDAAARPRIQHLLAVLAVLRHHLVMLLLLLLKLVVEGLELGALV